MEPRPLDRPIKGKLPFPGNHSVLFISNGAGADIEAIVRKEFDLLREIFQSKSYKFVYLPAYLEVVSPEFLSYLFPGENISIVEDIQISIQQKLELDVAAGFIRCDNGKLYLADFGDTLFGSTGREAILDYAENIGQTAEFYERKRRKNRIKEPVLSTTKDIEPIFDNVLEKKSLSKTLRGYPLSKEFAPEILELIHKDLKSMQNHYGTDIMDLIVLLIQMIRPLPMRITKTDRILIGSENKIEIELDQLHKAVYFLFLNHDEGILFKEIDKYEDELFAFYSRMCKQDDVEIQRVRISHLVKAKNRLNEVVSEIKETFETRLNPYLAYYYYISGKRGKPMRIPLDKNLVKGFNM